MAILFLFVPYRAPPPRPLNPPQQASLIILLPFHAFPPWKIFFFEFFLLMITAQVIDQFVCLWCDKIYALGRAHENDAQQI